MPEPAIRVFADLEGLSRGAADCFAEAARGRVAESGRFFAALSGGTTLRRLYELLGTSPWCDRMQWNNIHFFQVDERLVPPNHPESNFRMIREALLAPVRVPRSNFHRIAGESEDPAEVAHRYATELARVIPGREGDCPRLDLMVLGMGADGHTASLFPRSSALAEARLWVLPTEPGPNGIPRITLTLPVLNAAAQILILVAGAEKAGVLRRAIEGADSSDLLPAQCVRPARGQVTWFVDEAAAGGLQRHARSIG